MDEDKTQTPEIANESKIDNSLDVNIDQNKKNIRSLVRSDPEAYKLFMKQEYEYLYKVKKISKKKANLITVPIVGIMFYGLYEAANLLLGLNLPSLLTSIGI